MDRAGLDIPDLIVVEVVAPFIKVKSSDRVPIICIDAFEDGEEFVHGLCIAFGIALWDDQPFAFHVIPNRGREASLGQDEWFVNGSQLSQQSAQAMLESDQAVVPLTFIAQEAAAF